MKARLKLSLSRIVYVSRAAPGIGARDAYDSIRVSHNRNARYGLTGALLLVDGHFLQVLEGDGFRIRERYERIAMDPRHTDVELRQSRRIQQLSFVGEWMALRHDDEIAQHAREAHGYASGFPADRFDGDRLVAFAAACCGAHVEGQQALAWRLGTADAGAGASVIASLRYQPSLPASPLNGPTNSGVIQPP